MQVWSLGWEDPLEEVTATKSSILAWRIPWTEEPGGQQSMGSQRVGRDWVTNTFSFIKPLQCPHPAASMSQHLIRNSVKTLKRFTWREHHQSLCTCAHDGWQPAGGSAVRMSLSKVPEFLQFDHTRRESEGRFHLSNEFCWMTKGKACHIPQLSWSSCFISNPCEKNTLSEDNVDSHCNSQEKSNVSLGQKLQNTKWLYWPASGQTAHQGKIMPQVEGWRGLPPTPLQMCKDPAWFPSKTRFLCP